MRSNGPLFARLADALSTSWRVKARPSQLPPPGNWEGWLILAGRGFGKTRTGAEWIRSLAESASASRIGLVGPTAYLARSVMVEGESGILGVSSPSCRPIYEPSKHQLTWPNGVIASIASSEEPDQHRIPWIETVDGYGDSSLGPTVHVAQVLEDHRRQFFGCFLFFGHRVLHFRATRSRSFPLRLQAELDRAADSFGTARYIRLTPSPSIRKRNRQRIPAHARRLRR
jgi:hypothetical protein